jgi:dTMP kinase
MFVAFEGIDGSGKTTISNLAVAELTRRGLTLKHLRTQGRFVSVVTESIRTLARDTQNIDLTPQAEFLLYLARDVQLIHEALRPALAAHDVVVADRCHHTAEVLGHYGRHLPREWVGALAKTATAGHEPDLVILVDVDPTLARARRKASKLIAREGKPPSRKGLAGVGLQHRLRRGYLEYAASAPERWVVIDNEQALAPTVQLVADVIELAVRQGVPAATARMRAREATRPGIEARFTTASEAMQAFLRVVDGRAEREPQVAAYLLSGLWGAAIDARRRALSQVVPEVVLAGLSGLCDDASWELREALSASHPQAVARTLGGIQAGEARAVRMREALAGAAPVEVAHSLSRLDDEPAWSLRDRLYATQPAAVIASLSGLASERAWALRERWLSGVRAQVGATFELARLTAKSVGGLDDERAWRMRDLAMPAAPLSALSSVTGLLGERAWALRERYLQRATKLVMRTLRRIEDPRAFAMREAVAADCKEALDSMIGLDDPRAWALRDAYADVWPSTVLKTLGPLADTERGKALLERQLRLHADNLSLLKHASAIELGVHVGTAVADVADED